MKTVQIALLFFTTFAFSQIEKEAISFVKMKEEIKKELRQEMKKEGKSLSDLSNLSLRGYGVVNYFKYKYDTDPELRDKFDAERLNLYLEYKFTDKINFKSEIEFEHGGTGSTLSLDNQEEFGEVELEIEKGGEVKVEQVHINFQIQPYFNVRVGRMKVYFGLHQSLDTPTRYFTTTRQEMEDEILPLGWYENGLEFYGSFAKRLDYRLYVVNGLDASGFSSRNFIKGGYQQRFEMSNAESFAFAARLDYKFGKHKDTYFGLAAYVNDASANRIKRTTEPVSTYVTLLEGHLTYNEKNLRFNAIVLYGNIENSAIVSRENKNLSKILGFKRTPVGKNALGYAIEAGYNVMGFVKKGSTQMLYPFLRYEWYDTMRNEKKGFDNPRWERNTITTGFNWFVHPQIVLKAQYSNRTLGSEHYERPSGIPTGRKEQENSFSTGIGFSF